MADVFLAQWNNLLDWASVQVPDNQHLAVGLVVYLVVNAFLKQRFHLSSSVMKPVVFLHNFLLAIYSMATFYSAMLTVSENGWSLSFMYDSQTCSSVLKTRFYALAYLFYLSKYWEFADTWIVYLKGRNPLFLQTYHHIGAVISMHFLTLYRTEAVWIFVTWNSFIHSLMYTYYALTSIGIRPPGKSMLTSLQIVQFLTGLPSTVPYFFMDCFSGPAMYALAFNNVYVSYLVVLFVDFFKKSYSKKPKGKANGHANGHSNGHTKHD